jgi:hypothetical protein
MQICDLKNMAEWAARRISSQEETISDLYQLMKLREALDYLVQSYDFQTKINPEDFPPQVPQRRMRPTLAVDNDRQDTARNNPRSPKKI